jgi:hypothetical protein
MEEEKKDAVPFFLSCDYIRYRLARKNRRSGWFFFQLTRSQIIIIQMA